MTKDAQTPAGFLRRQPWSEPRSDPPWENTGSNRIQFNKKVTTKWWEKKLLWIFSHLEMTGLTLQSSSKRLDVSIYIIKIYYTLYIKNRYANFNTTEESYPWEIERTKVSPWYILLAFDRKDVVQMIFPSGLLEPGIRRLYTVTSILENFEFEPQLFVHPLSIKKEASTPFFSGSFRGNFEIKKTTLGLELNSKNWVGWFRGAAAKKLSWVLVTRQWSPKGKSHAPKFRMW